MTMDNTTLNINEFSQQDIQSLDVELKVGILGTVSETGLPHLTMISSLRPYAGRGLVWGQFTEGLSKQYIRQNPKTGFLIMSLDRHVWRGKACFTHSAKSGPEFENFNNLPMFRYNAYFGIHTVYYMELVSLLANEPLAMPQVILAALQTMLARNLGKKHKTLEVLNPWVRGLFNKVDNLKFLSYIDADGFPLILPVIQAQALDRQRVIFSTGNNGGALANIPPEVPMAVFGLSFSMEDVLLRGTYRGIQRVGGISCGVVEVDWVYNSMPPVPQQVYPPVKVSAVKNLKT
jgi:hypothetical protein